MAPQPCRGPPPGAEARAQGQSQCPRPALPASAWSRRSRADSAQAPSGSLVNHVITYETGSHSSAGGKDVLGWAGVTHHCFLLSLQPGSVLAPTWIWAGWQGRGPSEVSPLAL